VRRALIAPSLLDQSATRGGDHQAETD